MMDPGLEERPTRIQCGRSTTKPLRAAYFTHTIRAVESELLALRRMLVIIFVNRVMQA